jgi:alanine racemase
MAEKYIKERTRTWTEIDFDALRHNFRLAKRLAFPAKVMAVVKADAYGHGAVGTARALGLAGASFFAVATAEEALQLRNAGIGQDILLLGVAESHQIPALAKFGVSLMVDSPEMALAYSKAAGNLSLRVHIKLDTGMHRLGIPVGFCFDSAVENALSICSMRSINVEGIASHLASADDKAQNDFTLEQINRFKGVSDKVIQKIGRPLIRHCANSAALFDWPQSHFDMVRPGIMLFGAVPDPSMTINEALKPVMTLKSKIVAIKRAAAGETVGYGRAWRAERPSLIASVPIGYADGLPRGASQKIDMIVLGQRARQVGRICMDFSMIDVTDIPTAKPGDAVTIIGRDGSQEISAWDIAAANSTIAYEVLCNTGNRLPRICSDGGVFWQAR